LVGEAYALRRRLNKASQSNSVPFKSNLRWQYFERTQVGSTAAGRRKYVGPAEWIWLREGDAAHSAAWVFVIPGCQFHMLRAHQKKPVTYKEH